jgi:aminoglycoside phosphotransferase (APT) family kinase protein
VRVEDLTLVGAGRNAEVFAWADGAVLRLARADAAVFGERMAREAAALRALAGSGVPVPRLHDEIVLDGRPGTIIERCPGPDMLERVQRRPWTVPGAGAELGRLHARMHAIAAPAVLPPLTAELRLHLAQDAVPGDVRERALETLAGLPDGDRLCHGDLHPGNVLGPVVIDWDSAAAGPAEADVARTVLLLTGADPPLGTSRVVAALLPVGRRVLQARYLRAYGRERALDRGLVRRWLGVRAASRLAEGVDHERPSLLRLARRS